MMTHSDADVAEAVAGVCNQLVDDVEAVTDVCKQLVDDVEEYDIDQKRLELFKEVLKNTNQPQGHKDAALEYFATVRHRVYENRPHLLKLLGLEQPVPSPP
uniref:MIF4G domain-containing protein n=1 Tax=Steinernema glaseri TaxID=37863 RepID=A0A1I7ZI35_9BILA